MYVRDDTLSGKGVKKRCLVRFSPLFTTPWARRYDPFWAQLRHSSSKMARALLVTMAWSCCFLFDTEPQGFRSKCSQTIITKDEPPPSNSRGFKAIVLKGSNTRSQEDQVEIKQKKHFLLCKALRLVTVIVRSEVMRWQILYVMYLWGNSKPEVKPRDPVPLPALKGFS